MLPAYDFAAIRGLLEEGEAAKRMLEAALDREDELREALVAIAETARDDQIRGQLDKLISDHWGTLRRIF